MAYSKVAIGPSLMHRHNYAIGMQEEGGESSIEEKTQPHTYFDLYNKQQGTFNVCYIKKSSVTEIYRLGILCN